jgi:hypothetical protein
MSDGLTFEERVAAIYAPLPREDQIAAIEYVMARVDRCLGSTMRDTNRAVNLGADELGIRYKDAARLFKFARAGGAAYAIDKDPHLIRRNPKKPQGNVYFATCGWRVFKIGFSHSVPERIAQVTRLYQLPLELVSTVPGNLLDEHAFHIAARAAWLGGEFYDPAHLLNIPHFRFLREPMGSVAGAPAH